MNPPKIHHPSTSSQPDIEHGESSRINMTPSTSTAAHLAQELFQHSGNKRSFQECVEEGTQAVTLHVTQEHDRALSLNEMLTTWVNGLPEGEKNTGLNMQETLLKKRSNQKSLTLQFYTTSIPDFFAFFPSLEQLEMTCESAKLPDSIADAKKLKKLTILSKSEAFCSLPDTLGQLEGLTALTLNGCSGLTSFPSSIHRLKKLATLCIIASGAENPLPKNVNLFTKLQVVHINRCTSVGDALTQLQAVQTLKKLLFYDTPIHEGHLRAIADLSPLELLHISLSPDLREVPPVLFDQQKRLIELRITHCTNLRQLPNNLSQLANLQTLKLVGNSSLESLPDTIGLLSRLDQLDLDRCQTLSALPESIVNLTAGCCISLESRIGLSISTLEHLQRQTELVRLNSGGRLGPTVHFHIPTDVQGPIGTLSEEALKWIQQSGQQRELQEIEINSIHQLSPDLEKALATLLARFRKMAEFQRDPKKTVIRIAALLSELLIRPEALVACGAMALESISSCDDRTALGLLEMELALVEQRLMKSSISKSSKKAVFVELLDTASQVFKQRKLMHIAHEHAGRAKGFVDETEIVLKYLTSLGKSLNLPAALDHMLYERFAWQVKPTDLQQAQCAVEQAAEWGSEEFSMFLRRWYPFEVALMHHEPVMYHNIKQQCQQIDDAQQALLECLSEDYERIAEQEGYESSAALDLQIKINQLPQNKAGQQQAVWMQGIERAFANTKMDDSLGLDQPLKKPKCYQFF